MTNLSRMRAQETHGSHRCVVFGFRFSVFGFRFSVFGFRCSVFGVRCVVFGVARVAERRHDEAPDFSLGNTAPNHHQSRSDDRRLSGLLFICHWSQLQTRSVGFSQPRPPANVRTDPAQGLAFLSLIHISSPRDRTRSRMPSSA